MFLARAEGKGDKPFLWARKAGAWQPISWREATRQVAALAESLRRIGIEPGTLFLDPFARFVRAEMTKYEKVVRRSDIQPM